MGSIRHSACAMLTLLVIVSFTYAQGAPETLSTAQPSSSPGQTAERNPDAVFLAGAIDPMPNSGEAKERHEPQIILVSADPQHESTGLLDSPLPNYEPITGKQRLKWFALATGGPMSLFAAGPLSAGWGTMLNRPKEYGPHWEGFGQRYGMRLTGVSTGNAMEAVLGAIWKEDPRYFRSPKRSFGARVKYVIISPFIAPGPDGRFRPAYARYAGNVGNNFLSNTWRVPSESDPGDAAMRCLWGTLGKMGGNAFNEFWPDVKARVFGKK
jgi:hypothetical protein